MRSRILTEQERDILLSYLNKDTRLDGITVLLHRARKYLPDLTQEVSLLDKALEKSGKKLVRRRQNKANGNLSRDS